MGTSSLDIAASTLLDSTGKTAQMLDTSQPRHRSPSPAAVAHHEASHALAIMLAFRHAPWLPAPRPARAIHYVEIAPDPCCVGLDIFSRRHWSDKHDQRCIDLMQRQAGIHLAGGIGQAVHLGETRRVEVLRCAKANGGMGVDLERAEAVLADLSKLTGRPVDLQFFAERTLAVLLTHWSAVTALASALLEHRRIEGAEVSRIIDRAMRAS